MTEVRIGIDVGGTYTDAVVINNDSLEVIGKMKIPTTHDDQKGVSKGIVDILTKLMDEYNIAPKNVVFIAHGTTQATNALLEGDVAKIGIFAVSTGIDKRSALKDTNPGNIEIGNNKFLKTEHVFYDSNELTDGIIDEGINELIDKGAEVIVATESYSIEDSTNEQRIIERAKEKGILATGGHEISELYGLKVRTRTAIINASLIPKMIETANMTEEAVESTGITSSLMIMRCDGGVMNIEEMRKRPILTMLSGLAAGVAGALMYEKISDGIFFEVGGTSIDISVIKNGNVILKSAEVGGHKTYVNSLDVRTLGIAGGSMITIDNGKITDVGPRSAHIANKKYEAFSSENQMSNLKVKYIAPLKDDNPNYAILENENNEQFAYTLAGAANLLGYVPKEDYAYGNINATKLAWEALGKHLGITAEQAAEKVLDLAISKVKKIVDVLIDEYELNKSFSVLVGGGGSASVVVPALAELTQMKFQIAKNAPYISTIGVALAMVREQIERSAINPTDSDIKKIRSDVYDKIIQSGANEETINISVEIDAQKNILRAIAEGSTELRTKDLQAEKITTEEMKEIVSNSISHEKSNVTEKYRDGRWYIFESQKEIKKFLGLFKTKERVIVVLDREGVVRLKAPNAYAKKIKKKNKEELEDFIDNHTIYSDANAMPPKTYIFFKEKMIDLTGLQSKKQILSIAEVELDTIDGDDWIIPVVYQQ